MIMQKLETHCQQTMLIFTFGLNMTFNKSIINRHRETMFTLHSKEAIRKLVKKQEDQLLYIPSSSQHSDKHGLTESARKQYLIKEPPRKKPHPHLNWQGKLLYIIRATPLHCIDEVSNETSQRSNQAQKIPQIPELETNFPVSFILGSLRCSFFVRFEIRLPRFLSVWAKLAIMRCAVN